MQLQREKIALLNELQQVFVEKKVAVMNERIFKQENEELISTIKELKDNKDQAMVCSICYYVLMYNVYPYILLCHYTCNI